MTDLRAKSGPVEVTWEATVIRADGSREELGVVSYWNRNPLKRLAWALKNKLRRK